MLVLPSGKPMPLPYRWLWRHGLRELPPWSLIDDQARALALRDEFLIEAAAPNPIAITDWFPFARHQAQDDYAGFVMDAGVATDEVAVVHLTFKRSAELPGWPGYSRVGDFWSWLKSAIDDTAEFCEEPDED
jgi:hypothetical protein